MTKTKEVKTTCHALVGGFAACGAFEGKVPGQWPEGNTWSHNYKVVDCVGCCKLLLGAGEETTDGRTES